MSRAVLIEWRSHSEQDTACGRRGVKESYSSIFLGWCIKRAHPSRTPNWSPKHTSRLNQKSSCQDRRGGSRSARVKAVQSLIVHTVPHTPGPWYTHSPTYPTALVHAQSHIPHGLGARTVPHTPGPWCLLVPWFLPVAVHMLTPYLLLVSI